MEKKTLQKYLFNQRVKLYERLAELRELESLGLTTIENGEEIISITSKLEVIKDVIEICVYRSRY